MSKLKFDVKTAPMSKLIVNLSNPNVLASNLPLGVNHDTIIEAFTELADEIDRRIPTPRNT